jgi:RimJ/RimL family protein N-acetyltransferase
MHNIIVNAERKPFFVFPNIPSSGELSFEKLSLDNFQQLYLMFENDDNKFTDERFKHYASAENYASEMEQYGAYSPKHGAQDWLFLWKNEYAGILHLYDLSLENFADNDKRCWIGFAIKPALRNKGITKKAMQTFMQYIIENYKSIRYIHAMTDKNNKPAYALLFSLNFKQDFTERISKQHAFFVFTSNCLQ